MINTTQLPEKKLELLRKRNQTSREGALSLDTELQIVLESLYFIGQGEKIFDGIQSFDSPEVIAFLKSLLPVEAFYQEIGGIVGYHAKFLELLAGIKVHDSLKEYDKPPLHDLTGNDSSYVKSGILALCEMAEIYPIAGAADRLDLKDPKTGEALPAASLEFMGHTLLEGLIRDIVGREYLYYKLENKKTLTPIVLMTSIEKNNDARIHQILESHNWFNRPKESFYFVHQPLVPVLCHSGEWAVKGTLELALKPGGHGVIWKLMQDQGALEWLKKHGHHKVLIRQINNPIAGVDSGLLAIAGIGSKENKAFGFSSCDRYVGSEEGMVVLIKEKGHSSISNVEYTEFDHQGVEDAPKEPGSPFSQFPANSNILYANIDPLEKVIRKHPYPGLMINMKSEASLKTATGEVIKAPAARLETTMQNIADFLPADSTFVTYNLRRKTLAATKRSMKNGNSRDTPEGVFQEILKNNKELLELAGFSASSSFFLTYHPALGPLFSVIAQKLQKGTLHENAELQLEIADIFIKNLDLKGSLLIHADQVTEGRCMLENVKIDNQGIDSAIYWKNEINRKESINIKIEVDGEFHAKDIIFKGNYNIVVPAGKRMRAMQVHDSVEFIIEPLKTPSWGWNYSFNDKDDIILGFDNYGI